MNNGRLARVSPRLANALISMGKADPLLPPAPRIPLSPAPIPTLADIAFASPAARKRAEAALLTPRAFRGREPSGVRGFTTSDVDAIARYRRRDMRAEG